MKFLDAEQLKKLDVLQASDYCNDLRKYVIEKVFESGGHLASNLGVAEISVALIRCFNSPDDKIIYDVGHQSYIHKLLTDRIFDGTSLRAFGGYSGFTKREESEHDPFGSGHSSTALSAALGFSCSNRLLKKDNYSVAVVGDGAFCTGMTFEALNNITKDDKLIIILNDNEMSISENVGAFSSYLTQMRVTKKYFSFKRKTKNAFSNIPFVYKAISKTKNAIKRLLVKTNFFEDLGIQYLGPANGNDLETVETLINEAKSRKSPVLIHLITKKGKGFEQAELSPEKFHYVSPVKSDKITFSSAYSQLLINYAEKNKNAVAVTAAMCDGTGLNSFKDKFPERLFDVGISEEHAGTFSAALAAGGLIPFYTVYSTFFQRSYDQLIHDMALQNLKVIIALDRAGIVGADGPTHHGLYDVSMMLNVPGVEIYSPADFDELRYSFDSCVNAPSVSAMRYPRGSESLLSKKFFDSNLPYSIDTKDKCDVLLITYGRIVDEVLRAKALLMSKGYKVTVLKFLKLKPVEFSKINAIISALSPNSVFVVEEGMKTGGFGEYLLSNISISSDSEIIAVDEMFVPQGTTEELFDFCGLSAQKIYSRVLKCL